MSDIVRTTLGQPLQFGVRQEFDRLCDVMLRDLDYYVARRHRALRQATERGWTLPRIRVLLILSAFHRKVLGPLAAAFDTQTKLRLGTKVPLRYGATLSVDTDSGQDVRLALHAFDDLVRKSRIRTHWLDVASLSDLLFALSRVDEQSDE